MRRYCFNIPPALLCPLNRTGLHGNNNTNTKTPGGELFKKTLFQYPPVLSHPIYITGRHMRNNTNTRSCGGELFESNTVSIPTNAVCHALYADHSSKQTLGI